MEYSINALGKMAGVSTRTLRYYDEIGLLRPVRVASSGYRIYGEREVDRLQQILFYRELDLPLEDIKRIVTAPRFDERKALATHLKTLVSKRNRLDAIIHTVENTMATKEGRMTMSNTEKFEAFKQNLIEENEEKYGNELRKKYGEDTIRQSNAKVANMTEEQYQKTEELAARIIETFVAAYQTNDPAGPLAQQAADLHRQWLSMWWNQYTKEGHAGVAQMYVDDERFTQYYDQHQPGLAVFVRDAVWVYTGQK